MTRIYLLVWSYETESGRIALHWREESFRKWIRHPKRSAGLKRGNTRVEVKQTLFSTEVDGHLSKDSLRNVAKCHLDGDCELVSVSLRYDRGD